MSAVIKMEETSKSSEKEANNKKVKGQRGRKEAAATSNLDSKIVVRRLPPSMTEEDFLEAVSPLPDLDHFYFVTSNRDPALEPHNFSRAYINLVNTEDAFVLKDKFDGYVFIDGKTGNEYPAMVEFAPYQKVNAGQRSKGKKADAKCGTIGEDKEYLDFIKALEEAEPLTLTMQEQLEELELRVKERNALENKTTPLLEALKVKKAERDRIREEKRAERMKKKQEEKEKAKTETSEVKVVEIKSRSEKEKERRKKRDEERKAKRERNNKKDNNNKNNDGNKKDNNNANSKKEPNNKRDNVVKKASNTNKRESKRDKEQQQKQPEDDPGPAPSGSGASPTKPKRYSARRKEQQQQGASNVEDIIKESEAIQSLQEMSIQEDEKESVDSKNKKKNNRPAQQIYRPGMGKFSSQKSKEDGGEESGESGSKRGGGGRGGRGGRGRVFYNKNRQQKKERPE